MHSTKSAAIIAKNPNYWSDGTGRDTYISYDNGGVLTLPSTFKGGLMRGESRSNTRLPKLNHPVMTPKFTHYIADGSGRDFCIKVNEGGQSSNYISRSPDQFFSSQLRTYDKRPPTRSSTYGTLQPDYFADSQNAVTTDTKLKELLTFKSQRDSVKRLAEPKQRTLPLYKMQPFGPRGSIDTLLSPNNRYGQLGLCTDDEQDVQEVPQPCCFNVQIDQISCGGTHTAFIAKGGYLYAFGNNEFGQLGLNAEEPNLPSPSLVGGQEALRFKQVACGSKHTAAILLDGTVYTWGCGFVGQLGLGDHMNQKKPRRVIFDRASTADTISCGSDHTLILSNSKVYAFGAGDLGQLGLGKRENTVVPSLLASILSHQIKDVAAGRDFSLLLTKKGEVYATGNNNDGQCGLGPVTGTMIPVRIPGLDNKQIIQIRAGSFAGCLDSQGLIYLWGSCPFGLSKTPHVPEELRSFDAADFQIGTSAFMTILTTNQQVYSWGVNDFGQLGVANAGRRVSLSLVDSLSDKNISRIACGHSFVIALGGEVLPQQSGDLDNFDTLNPSQFQKPKESREGPPREPHQRKPSITQEISSIELFRMQALIDQLQREREIHLQKIKILEDSNISYEKRIKELETRLMTRDVNPLSEVHDNIPLREYAGTEIADTEMKHSKHMELSGAPSTTRQRIIESGRQPQHFKASLGRNSSTFTPTSPMQISQRIEPTYDKLRQISTRNQSPSGTGNMSRFVEASIDENSTRNRTAEKRVDLSRSFQKISPSPSARRNPELGDSLQSIREKLACLQKNKEALQTRMDRFEMKLKSKQAEFQ